MVKLKHKVTGEFVLADDYINARDDYGLFVIRIKDLLKDYIIVKE